MARGKRELILAHAREMSLDLASSYAYGDSPGDHDLLELVGYPSGGQPDQGHGSHGATPRLARHDVGVKP